MSKLRKNRSGFTLIELMVVVIIVAILAAVAVPLMQGNVNNARSSEAAAGLGQVRTNLRTVLAQTGSYPINPVIPALTPVIGGANPIAGMQARDLLGRYFDDNDFTYQTAAVDANNLNGRYCVSVVGNTGPAVPGATAPNAAQTAGISRSIDQNGDIRDNINCAGIFGGTGAIIN